MTYLVKPHIFSGRPDPVWTISDATAERLFAAAEAQPAQFSADVAAGESTRRGLGYRGISLVRIGGEPGGDMLMASAAAEMTAFVANSPELEARLLETGAGLIPSHLREMALSAIGSPVSAGALEVTGCPTCAGASAPVYDPDYWNNDPTILYNNNCYNYANNQVTNSFAQPGRGSGQTFSSIDCADVGAAAVRDGLQPMPDFQAPVPGWYVALVIWPGVDYHWYRQDQNGCWSHKPGSTEARNYDNSGNPIADPQFCDRGPYTVFCTYMATDASVTID